MTIKAIETIYKGYRFRSRLEARWAVFFDEMGYDWEYESEGYELRDGTWYLPDFKIKNPDFMQYAVNDYPHRYQRILHRGEEKYIHFEIKGTEPSDEEKNKCKLLTLSTERPTALVWGDPVEYGLMKFDLSYFSISSSGGSSHLSQIYDFWDFGKCWLMDLDECYEWDDTQECEKGWFIGTKKKRQIKEDDVLYGYFNDVAMRSYVKYVQAALKARQARFEHR